MKVAYTDTSYLVAIAFEEPGAHKLVQLVHSMDAIYSAAWEMGLKTTYYLRTMAVSQIEKSTLDAVKYYFTQKRSYQNTPVSAKQTVLGQDNGIFSSGNKTPARPVTKFNDILDSDCEVCT